MNSPKADADALPWPACASINTVAEALEDPQIAARGLRIDVEGVSGLRTPLAFSRSPLALGGSSPLLGGG